MSTTYTYFITHEDGKESIVNIQQQLPVMNGLALEHKLMYHFPSI